MVQMGINSIDFGFLTCLVQLIKTSRIQFRHAAFFKKGASGDANAMINAFQPAVVYRKGIFAGKNGHAKAKNNKQTTDSNNRMALPWPMRLNRLFSWPKLS
jgi:hypothetical protein